ncbi:MAG: hypothetical protein U5L75_01110 [Candidatus Campbellbacteria bacterium]|nr:hypothetical protein [Candidatus Campbellbacteria bacterium]
MQNSKFNFWPSAIMIAVLVTSSFFVGFFVGNDQTDDIERVTEVDNKTSSETQIDFSPYWKAWRILNEKHIEGEGYRKREKAMVFYKGLSRSLR